MFVCAECFENESGLSAFIANRASSSYCDYCDREESYNFAVRFDIVAEHIHERIQFGWIHAEEELGWIDGEYVGAPYYQTAELLWEIGLGLKHDELHWDLCNFLGDYMWTQGIHGTFNDRLRWSWWEFTEVIKHHSRYVFFRIDTYSNEPDGIKPRDMLDRLGKIINSINLITKWQPGKIIYRARIDDNQSFSTAKDLGTTPKKYAIYSNRMSPAGIPMFYGALDEKTTLREVRADSNGIVSLGTFRVLQEINVLDLTQLGRTHSLFDEKFTFHEREIQIFLQKFVENVSKPVKKDGKEHIEYVPTQVFTEYIRYLLRPSDSKIMGIVYPSAVHKGYNSCVLFVENEHCVDEPSDEAWLQLCHVKHICLNEE